MDREPPKTNPRAARRTTARYANWTIGLAAALLVLASAGGYFRHRGQLASLAAEHLRLIVTGPSVLREGVAAEYTISTTAVDGRALPAEVEAVLSAPDGRLLRAFRETADENGRVKVAIPADAALPPRVVLKVTARRLDNIEEAEATLAVVPDRFDTLLALDRTEYRPGDTAYFRSLTLSRFRLNEIPEGKVRFEIVGPGGAAVRGLASQAVVRRGAAGGAIVLPAGLDDGRYSLVVRGDGDFPTARQEFAVRRAPADRPTPVVQDASTQQEPAAPELPKQSGTDGNGASLLFAERVFEAGSPLKFHVRSAQRNRPLIAAVYVRGAQVGQRPLLGAGNAGPGQPVQIDADAAVGGPARVALFDYGVSPPQPLHAKTIYRWPARKLNVGATGAEKRFSPGEGVELTLLATDEDGRPVPAAFGLSVVSLKNSTPGNSRGQTAPGNEGRGPGAFRGPLAPGYFNLELEAENAPRAAFERMLDSWPHPFEQPPLMRDNIEQIRADYEAGLAAYRADRAGFLDTLTAASFLGGLGLVLLVAMLGLLRIVSGIHLWASAVGATTCCMILGAILMDPGRLAPDQPPAAGFAAYQAPDDAPPEAADAEAPVPLAVGTADDLAETVHWLPLLIADESGKASVRFDAPKNAAALEVITHAHGAGRLGSLRTRIDVLPPGEKK